MVSKWSKILHSTCSAGEQEKKSNLSELRQLIIDLDTEPRVKCLYIWWFEDFRPFAIFCPTGYVLGRSASLQEKESKSKYGIVRCGPIFAKYVKKTADF